MGDKTSIEWTDATWNPVTGCTKVSQGCKFCYAERVFPRPYPGRAFTDIREHDDRLPQPLSWKKPRRIFVNSMSDLFHDEVSDFFLRQVFGVMAMAHQHTFQVLTKRSERMREWVGAGGRATEVLEYVRGCELGYQYHRNTVGFSWPLPNVWLGVSVENQEMADQRIPSLLQTPAAVRFISAEPLLGPIDIAAWLYSSRARMVGNAGPVEVRDQPYLDWVIAGGESGPKARASHLSWHRSLRDQCAAAAIPFLFKQWGEWAPQFKLDGLPVSEHHVFRVGKKAAGRVLDGRTHDEFPT